ncbi:ATP-binding protein [Sandaracinus amylolyticus]|uniref:ATP-binding response regulator n=1 Tax=Sandaracinus amylolyticus TaxID=927083 RepID=UPI001F2CD2AF|nr:ATP-binding protein [Sandaracinus amylolyticus]UJR80882.1 Sensor histidine kinase [Sandaracinus amylolyticus]
MNPVADDSLDWLAGLGLVVIEERLDGAARSIGPAGASIVERFDVALARAAHLTGSDPRLGALIRQARASGAAMVELAGARIGLHRRGERLLAIVVPQDRTSASIVHELANALTGIAGWTRLATTAGPMPERARSAVEVLDRATNDALDTARTLLASLQGPAEIGEGSDVSDVVGAAISMLRPLADDKDIVVRAKLPTGLRAAARPAELRAIATNLIKNAIEALEPGGEIVVAADAADDRVVLTVVDDGPGMDDDTLAHIFDPFVTHKASGTGLGLALVRDLAQARGGDVRAESGRGRGARFVVRLPALVDARAEARERRQNLRGSGVRRRSTAPLKRPIRVLVVDDDESLRGMVTATLEIRGASVVAVPGVQEAMAVDQNFDLALVDLSLRDGRGDCLLSWLHEHQRTQRAVLMSGAPVTPDEVTHADEVLRKPFTLEDLAEVVDRVVRPSASARSNRSR